MLPENARGVPRAGDRRVLNGIFRVLRSGAPWRDLAEQLRDSQPDRRASLPHRGEAGFSGPIEPPVIWHAPAKERGERTG